MAESADAEYERMVALRNQGALTPSEFDAWCLRNFATLPGTHLTLRQGGAATWELVTADGEVWARCRGGSFTHFHQLWRGIDVRGESYRWRGFGTTIRKTHELVAKSSSEVVLRMTGTHFNKKATTRVELIGQDTYGFPVKNGMMSAVDSSGNILARYRLNRSRIKVNPDPRKMIEVVADTSGLSIFGFDLVVAVSTVFIGRYSEVPVGSAIS